MFHLTNGTGHVASYCPSGSLRGPPGGVAELSFGRHREKSKITATRLRKAMSSSMESVNALLINENCEFSLVYEPYKMYKKLRESYRPKFSIFYGLS